MDPYRALLDVRDQRRPPNAYSLLGLPDGESDPERIDRAIRTRRSILMQRQRQASPMVWQRISDELIRAVNTLSDPQKKAQYDETLTGESHSGGNGRLARHSAGGSLATQAAPVAAVAATSACPSCHSGNLPGRKFCGSCGQALIEPCAECGAETMVDECFCGACGVDLEEACARREELAQRDMLRAARLNEEGRYQEALGIVQPLSELRNRRLAEVSRQARELAEEIVGHKDQSKSRVDDAVAAAIRAIEHHQWERAVEAIESIPALLRKKEHKQLRVEAQQALDELEVLHREIRAAVQAKQTADLLGKVERFLQLAPGDERMMRLADQLRARHQLDAHGRRDQLIGQAKSLLDEHQYQEAYDLLKQVPDGARNDEFTQLDARLQELAFLWDSLRHSPTVDRTLVDLAQRLMKLSPNDPKLPAILAQLNQRASKPKRQPLEIVPWARAPEETAVGPSVKRLASFGTINIDKVAGNGLFVENAPRLYPACGAALQGLGHAVIETNLLPKSDSGVLGSLRSWVKRAGRVDAAWGIELSASGLKGVKLVRKGDKGDVAVDAFDLVEHATLLGGVTSEAQRRDVMAATLKTFVDRNATKDTAVCLAYPGRQVLGKFFSIPPIEDKKADELMLYEARRQVPFPLDQLTWDFHAWPGAGDEPSPRDVMLLAAKRHYVVQHLALFEDASVRVNLLQSDCVALHNFYQHALARRGATPAAPSQTVMLLDVGADATNCVVSGQRSMWCRSFARGGDDFCKALVRRFEVSFAATEQLKRDPMKVHRISSLREAWKPLFEQLLRDIRESLAAHDVFDASRQIDVVLACGGGMRIHGLHRHLLG